MKLPALAIMVYIYPLFLKSLAQDSRFPTINCPGIFQYSYDKKLGGWYGLVTVRQDGSSVAELQINMTMNARIPVTVSIYKFECNREVSIIFFE